MIAGASRATPVVLDGLMTGIAALWAARFNKEIKNYLFASHCSLEPAHAFVLKELQLTYGQGHPGSAIPAIQGLSIKHP